MFRLALGLLRSLQDAADAGAYMFSSALGRVEALDLKTEVCGIGCASPGPGADIELELRDPRVSVDGMFLAMS